MVYFKIQITSIISKMEIPTLKNLLIEFKKIPDNMMVEILAISIHNKILLFIHMLNILLVYHIFSKSFVISMDQPFILLFSHKQYT